MIRGHRGYNNGISHYIEAREGYDRLLDLERYGAKIRDTDDEFKGADFRDEATKLMFAYDYVNRFTLRVWGTTFKRAMYRGAKILKAQVVDRTMGAGLLTEGGRMGARVVGAVAINGRTGKFTVCRAKSVVFCMSRPTRLWLFAPGATGISEFRPPQCTGDGHAMAWRVGGSVHDAREVASRRVVGPAQLPAVQHRQQPQHLVRVHDDRRRGPPDPVAGPRRPRAARPWPSATARRRDRSST